MQTLAYKSSDLESESPRSLALRSITERKRRSVEAATAYRSDPEYSSLAERIAQCCSVCFVDPDQPQRALWAYHCGARFCANCQERRTGKAIAVACGALPRLPASRHFALLTLTAPNVPVASIRSRITQLKAASTKLLHACGSLGALRAVHVVAHQDSAHVHLHLVVCFPGKKPGGRKHVSHARMVSLWAALIGEACTQVQRENVPEEHLTRTIRYLLSGQVTFDSPEQMRGLTGELRGIGMFDALGDWRAAQKQAGTQFRAIPKAQTPRVPYRWVGEEFVPVPEPERAYAPGTAGSCQEPHAKNSGPRGRMRSMMSDGQAQRLTGEAFRSRPRGMSPAPSDSVALQPTKMTETTPSELLQWG